MLTLTFLGIGSAFSRRNRHSNVLLEAWAAGPDRQAAPDEAMLVDFGGAGPLALHELSQTPGFDYLRKNGAVFYPAVGSVFVTHLHGDHIGGLEEFAILSLRMGAAGGGEKRRPRLLGGFDVLERLWEQSLRGGLSVFDGREMNLADYFEVIPLDSEGANGAECWKFRQSYDLLPFRTDHIRLFGPLDWPSYGLVIRDGSSGKSAFLSGDTRFDPQRLLPKMAASSICFHDAQLEAEARPVHALLSELRALPAEIRERTHLYHVGDHWDDPVYGFVAEEFAGFARPRVRYDLF